MEKNYLISENDLKFARPRAKGLSPSLVKKIIGKKLNKNVVKNEMVKFKTFKKWEKLMLL